MPDEPEVIEVDLDAYSVAESRSDGREIFNPSSKSAWPGVSKQVYLSTHRAGPLGLVQVGYDPTLEKAFVRANAGTGGRWSDWLAVEAPPPPPEARKAKGDDDDQTEAQTSSSRKK